jgi:nanoRNase/pAp phosphatase (c-di-AMP/oligoRNAs hydrolase)
LVLINPDPDSIASALAVKRLLSKRAHKTVMTHINEIKRLDNLAMVKLLMIPTVPFDQIDTDSFTHRVLVDAQPDHSEVFESFTYDAIIDHHPRKKKWNARYVDIRPKYGANSSIMTEYLRGAGIKPSMKLATALLYAIKTDTANFERAGIEEDVKQFRYLFQFANMNRLKKIEKSEFRVDDLDYFKIAVENRIVTRKGIYSHLGKVPSADLCVQVADFFTRIHGVGWVFVSGVHEGKVIIIIRNDGSRKDAGKVVTAAFGDYGPAGGHEGAARAEIPLSTLKKMGIQGYSSSLKSFIRKRLKF